MDRILLLSFAIRTVSKREENDEAHECEDGKDEDAAFGTGRSAAEDGFAHGVCGEEMVLGHQAAVRDAVEKRLTPIP